MYVSLLDMHWETTYLKWDEGYDADSLIDISVSETPVGMTLRHLQIMVKGTREKHFRTRKRHVIIPGEPATGHYTGPLCTPDNPCRRCRENEAKDEWPLMPPPGPKMIIALEDSDESEMVWVMVAGTTPKAQEGEGGEA